MLASWLTRPFAYAAPRNALIGGVLVAIICACVGVWVVQRGLAFLGEALGHGLLPGLAIANAAGVSLLLGAAASAVVMVLGVGYVTRRGKVRSETSIGLLFVGMLSVGVLIVSRQDNFARDLTQFLFGDITGVTAAGNRWLLLTAVVVAAACVALHRPLMASAFDQRKAATLGMRPALAELALLALVAVSVVASFRIVGTMLVFALLVAPPSTALLLVRRVSVAVVVAALLGAVAVLGGVLLSFHQRLAASAAMAAIAAAQFFVVLLGREVLARLQRRTLGPSSDFS